MVKVGDRVTRYISSARIPMEMVVTAVDDHFIYCGDWKFDLTHGYEVDEELGWGVERPGGQIITGSWIEI